MLKSNIIKKLLVVVNFIVGLFLILTIIFNNKLYRDCAPTRQISSTLSIHNNDIVDYGKIKSYV